MNETELTTKILDFLLEHGETKSREVKVLNTNRKTMDNNLIRMFEAGILSRRKMDKKFAYSIRDREDFYLNDEPGYAYYLRNLPRSAVIDQLQGSEA
jgi:predicted transcriptional regulator